jgi:hypothetical protein
MGCLVKQGLPPLCAWTSWKTDLGLRRSHPITSSTDHRQPVWSRLLCSLPHQTEKDLRTKYPQAKAPLKMPGSVSLSHVDLRLQSCRAYPCRVNIDCDQRVIRKRSIGHAGRCDRWLSFGESVSLRSAVLAHPVEDAVDRGSRLTKLMRRHWRHYCGAIW